LTKLRGKLIDCDTERDDAAKPMLAVPKKNKNQEKSEMLKGLIGKKIRMT
jgi:hypothetical protein